jgi:hypothetical protein
MLFVNMVCLTVALAWSGENTRNHRSTWRWYVDVRTGLYWSGFHDRADVWMDSKMGQGRVSLTLYALLKATPSASRPPPGNMDYN